MTPHYERFIIGSAYENRKRHHRCTFPKPNGQQCGYFSSHMDVLNHLAIFHLQHSRFSCNVCEDRFLLQIQFETHRKTDRCPASDHDLVVRNYDGHAEVTLWRLTNVFIREITGSELKEELRKRKHAEEQQKNCSFRATTPCYNYEQNEEDNNNFDPVIPAPMSSVRPMDPPVSYFNAQPLLPTVRAVAQPMYLPPPPPPPPVPPFPIIQRENLHQSSQPSTNSIHDQERQARLRSIVNRRRSRSRAPVQEQQEQPTGVVSLKPSKPQEMRGRSRSRVNYQRSERAVSPMRLAEAGEIEEVHRRQYQFNVASRATSKVPSMRSNRNALLLEPVATPATVSQSRTSRKDALERNRAYAARKAAAAETAARNTEQLSSRSRSPHQRSSRSNKYGY